VSKKKGDVLLADLYANGLVQNRSNPSNVGTYYIPTACSLTHWIEDTISNHHRLEWNLFGEWCFGVLIQDTLREDRDVVTAVTFASNMERQSSASRKSRIPYKC